MSVFQVEDLRSARNYFYIGRYAKAMEEATAAQHPDSETLRLRAWAELSPADVVAAISSSAPTPHQAVKLYATYKLAKDAAAKEAVIATLTNYLSDADIMTDQTLRIIGAQLFVLEKDYKRALSTLNSADNSMEKNALLVQIYLALDRLDLASKHVKAMQEQDDDDTLTQLSTSWLLMARRDAAAFNEAHGITGELAQKLEASPNLMTASGACLAATQQFKEGFQSLKRAREIALRGKETVPAETLINSMVSLHHHSAQSDEVVSRIMAELKATHPNHAYLVRLEGAERAFAKAAGQYTL